MDFRDWVIDADTHITEPGDLWTRRLPAKFRERAPRLVRNPENQWDVWQIGDSSPLVPVGFTAVAGWPEPFPSAPRNMDEVPRAAYDAAARLAYMDSIGIWAMAIYPNVGGFGSQAFLNLRDAELMLACVQAYNDFLLEAATSSKSSRHSTCSTRSVSTTCCSRPTTRTRSACTATCARRSTRACVASPSPFAARCSSTTRRSCIGWRLPTAPGPRSSAAAGPQSRRGGSGKNALVRRW